MLECIDHFVTAVVSSVFNWHIINWSLSSIRKCCTWSRLQSLF